MVQVPGSTLGNVNTLDHELTETQTLGDVQYARYLGDVQNALAGGLTADTLLSLRKKFSEHLEGKKARKSHQIFQAIMGFDPAIQAKCLEHIVHMEKARIPPRLEQVLIQAHKAWVSSKKD